MKGLPTLEIAYRTQDHRQLPHVVKFSGGRSSALLLFSLLANDQLDPQRGDVIVFNNTSAEHMRTYDFVIRCKEEAERLSDVPFLLTEFQTYETARDGFWRRAKSWRLAKPCLWSSDKPNGLRHGGEIFEEAIALNTRLPNRFQRLCTDHLKVQVTRNMLSEWFSGEQATRRLGHYHETSQVTDREIARSYQGSSLSESELLRYVRFLRDCPLVRPSQSYANFTSAPRIAVESLQEQALDGRVVMSGNGAVPYVTVLGLRADEPARVGNILNRAQGDGAVPYFPLFDASLAAEDVLAFWRGQEWDLDLDGRYSNCTFCFMKGIRTLRAIAKEPKSQVQGPSQLQWWADLETRYQRHVEEVRDSERTGQTSRFGFFGKNSRHTYANLLELDPSEIPLQELPCHCTD